MKSDLNSPHLAVASSRGDGLARDRRPRSLLACSLATLCLTAAISRAEELTSPAIALQGFGTAAVDYHDDTALEYRRTTAQARGVRAGELDFATDSVLGLQLTVSLTGDLQVVAQGM